MKSVELLRDLNLLKESVIQECRHALESMVQAKYSLEHGYEQIVLTFPLYDPILGSPIYVNSCFDGEDNILIRSINCFPDGISVGCHYVDRKHSWRANICDVCMHVKDMICILELIEKMQKMNIVYDYLHVKFKK